MRRIENQAVQIWILPGAVWFALLILLTATVGSAYIPLGAFNTVINMLIAAAKVALILLFFMKLRSSSPMIRLTSLAGLFWLTFMFALTAGDYLTRQNVH
jgi:cytochrome c oxidase subunit 4